MYSYWLEDHLLKNSYWNKRHAVVPNSKRFGEAKSKMKDPSPKPCQLISLTQRPIL